MSLAHFDDIYEICCGMMEEEETLTKPKHVNERLDPLKNRIPEGHRWWEEAIKDSLNKKEREVTYV